jgi:hypothetical protein
LAVAIVCEAGEISSRRLKVMGPANAVPMLGVDEFCFLQPAAQTTEKAHAARSIKCLQRPYMASASLV